MARALPEDRDFVARLSEEVFARFGPYGTYLPEILGNPRVTTLVARSGALAVGFAMLAFESATSADLVAIATLPAWQSRGVGRRLLEEVERRVLGACRRGRPWLHLSVAVDNVVARRLFESAGFVPAPGAAGVYPGGQPSLGMRKRLRHERAGRTT